MSPFIVYALPRSRSYWLSRFLSYGPWACDHDASVRLRGLDDVRSMLDTPFTGSVETGAAPWWRLVHKMRPDVRTVVLRRPVEECLRSLAAAGGPEFDTPHMRRVLERVDAKLGQIERRVPGVLSITAADLDTVEGCRAVFEHCLQRPFDPEWHRLMAPVNLQINLPAQVRYCRANAPQIERLMGALTQSIRADLTASRRVGSDSMTYAEEPFEDFLRDGRRLIAEHHVAVGKPADEVDRMNLDLMRDLAAAGVLHVTTARSNGRVFGYLMTLTSPALDSPSRLETHTTAWFADPCAPGVGAKLFRTAVAAARSRGVQTVYSRAGNVGGSGRRNGAIFQRLGAHHFGDLYALELN